MRQRSAHVRCLLPQCPVGLHVVLCNPCPGNKEVSDEAQLPQTPVKERVKISPPVPDQGAGNMSVAGLTSFPKRFQALQMRQVYPFACSIRLNW